MFHKMFLFALLTLARASIVSSHRLVPRVVRTVQARPSVAQRVPAPVAEESFDFSGKEQFDLLSLRKFRRDAIVQYDATNQSEPLRIALAFLGLLFALLYPSLAGELGSNLDGVVNNLIALILGAGSGTLFLSNRAARTARLERISREYAIGDLRATYRGVRTQFLRDLRGRLRVVALAGPAAAVDTALEEATAYRRRLDLASVAVVPVYLEGDGATYPKPEAAPGWLWAAAEPAAWRAYFTEQLNARQLLDSAETSQGAWIALSLRGRSAGSAVGLPRWDELLGTQLQPTKFRSSARGRDQTLAEGAAASAALGYPVEEAEVAEVLDAQAQFYTALTGGDLAAMEVLWNSSETDNAVSEALEAGGRLDPWPSQLREDSRPAGLRAVDCDALVVGDRAWTTAIEEPALGGELLATQRWQRVDGRWLLRTHRTIPWDSGGGSAVVTLRCDGRGCVSLGRIIDTPTFSRQI